MDKWMTVLPAALLLACHDSPRDNPLDPELTPGVELAVVADDTAGTATLQWSPYAGTAPFREYRVLRNVVRSTEAETLLVAASPESTLYVDRTRQPEIAYEYRLEVVNQAGLAVASPPQRVPGYQVAGVVLHPVKVDPTAGVLGLTWSRYRGPGFAEYRLRRRLAGAEADTVVCIRDAVGDTAGVDTTARHGLSYTYQVELQAQGRTWTSPAVSGRLLLPACDLTGVQPEPTTATAELRWKPYTGPAFAAYEVQRRTAALDWAILATLTDPAASAFGDAGLRGNTEYRYQVVVRTTRGEEVHGQEASAGIFLHRWTWPVGIGTGRAFVRLEHGQADTIAVMVSDKVGSPPSFWPDVDLVKLHLPEGPVERKRIRSGFNWQVIQHSLMQNTVSWSPAGNQYMALVGNSRNQQGPTAAMLELRSETGARAIWTRADLPGHVWLGLAAMGPSILFTVDQTTYRVDSAGSLAQGPDLEGRVSEVRAWQTRRGWAAGVCLPQESLVLYGDVPDPAAADWAANLSRRIGPTLGRSGDPLVYPMSFDVGAHGEFYLLDAGRDRVLVLNSARQYVTEWGEPGNGEGQFDFGPGTPTWTREQDYGGSLVVDPQGRVWVADEYNQRIQVFEP